MNALKIQIKYSKLDSKCIVVEETKKKPTIIFEANVPRSIPPSFNNQFDR